MYGKGEIKTTMRGEVSKKNKYWIERHRFYELKHFCLQYPIWQEAYNSLDGLSARPVNLPIYGKANNISNPTERIVMLRFYYLNRMGMIDKTAEDTDKTIAPYIIKGVTQGISYDAMNAQEKIPCCRDVYYELYRRFFWLLNKVRE